jgi:chitin disaccharide deacetylase
LSLPAPEGHSRRTIITADDFGLSPDVTGAVLDSLRMGLVTHASLLINMAASEEACALVRDAGLESRIGLHFNLTEGRPLTEAMRRTGLFCENGHFNRRSFLQGLIPLSCGVRRVLADEARAQLSAARKCGIPLSHLDSHNDVHLALNIAPIVVAVAREAGIRRVRPARNCGQRLGVVRRPLYRFYNAWLDRQGVRRVRYFGSVDDILPLLAAGRLTGAETLEIMTHPRLNQAREIVDAPSSQSLAVRLSQCHPYLS